MNLHNLSEKDFDAEIKERLKNSSVPFDPVSWEKMSQKLDHEFTETSSVNSRLLELLLVALVLSAYFFWNVGTFPQSNSSEVGLNNTTVDQFSKNSQQKSEVPRVSNSGNVETGTKSAGQGLSQGNVAINEKEIDTKISNDGKTGISSGQIMQKGTTLAGTPGSLVVPKLPAIESIDPIPVLPDKIMGTDTNNAEDPPVIENSASPWFVGFGYAPDFSLVGFSEVTKPGTNLSVLVEYQLNRRWSIQSGFTYSKKNYQADGEDYNPPEGFWDYGVVPETTDAVCDVIDIPINIRYYFNPVKNNRLFASTGFSTYLMLTEDYYYQYENNDPHLVQSWSGRNENQHYFAIYNLSLGYQRAIGLRWFLEIEPFVKLPLTGVGFGEVNLWSTGTSFSVKYNFK